MNSNNTTLQLGVIGFGKLAQDYYLAAFRKLRHIKVVAVADPLQKSRDVARTEIRGVKCYSSHTVLLQHESIDAILVASPPSTHLQIWNELSAYGKPIFLEKPFLVAGQLPYVTVAAQAHSPLMVNFNRRLWPMYKRLRQMVEIGMIGDITGGEFTLQVNVQPWLSVTTHRLSPSEGGVLFDLGSQILDLIHFVLKKDPVRIHAESSSGSEVNTVNLLVELTDGVTVRAQVGYSGRNRESLILRGTNGNVQVHDPNMTIHFVGKDSSATMISDAVRDWLTFGYRAIRREESMLRYTIWASLERFIDAVRGHRPFVPGFDDAIRNALWLETAHQSLLRGEPVRVDEIKEQVACVK